MPPGGVPSSAEITEANRQRTVEEPTDCGLKSSFATVEAFGLSDSSPTVRVPAGCVAPSLQARAGRCISRTNGCVDIVSDASGAAGVRSFSAGALRSLRFCKSDKDLGGTRSRPGGPSRDSIRPLFSSGQTVGGYRTVTPRRVHAAHLLHVRHTSRHVGNRSTRRSPSGSAVARMVKMGSRPGAQPRSTVILGAAPVRPRRAIAERCDPELAVRLERKPPLRLSHRSKHKDQSRRQGDLDRGHARSGCPPNASTDPGMSCSENWYGPNCSSVS